MYVIIQGRTFILCSLKVIYSLVFSSKLCLILTTLGKRECGSLNHRVLLPRIFLLFLATVSYVCLPPGRPHRSSHSSISNWPGILSLSQHKSRQWAPIRVRLWDETKTLLLLLHLVKVSLSQESKVSLSLAFPCGFITVHTWGRWIMILPFRWGAFRVVWP